MESISHERAYVEPIIVTSAKDEMYVENLKINKDGLRGMFHIPIYLYPALEDKALQENWNIKDIKKGLMYQTFLEANFSLSDATIKAVYTNNKYKWITLREWIELKEFKSGWIHELKIRPYFYTDEYGQEMIAGQLKYMELCMEKPLETEDKLTRILNEDSTSVKADPTESSDKNTQLVNVVYALGLTPKEAIKILIEEV